MSHFVQGKSMNKTWHTEETDQSPEKRDGYSQKTEKIKDVIFYAGENKDVMSWLVQACHDEEVIINSGIRKSYVMLCTGFLQEKQEEKRKKRTENGKHRG